MKRAFEFRATYVSFVDETSPKKINRQEKTGRNEGLGSEYVNANWLTRRCDCTYETEGTLKNRGLSVVRSFFSFFA